MSNVIQQAIDVMDKYSVVGAEFREAWQTLKTAVLAQQTNNCAMVPCRAGAVMKGSRCGVAGKKCDGMCMVLLDARHQ